MPRSDIQDPQTFQRFQGIDTRDDAEGNTASDIMNVRVDDTGRLTNAPLPEKITTTADEELAVWAYHVLADDGQEVDCDIDEFTETPAGTLAITDATHFTITLSAGIASTVERIIAVTTSPVMTLLEGRGFSKTVVGNVITCTHASADFVTRGLSKVIVWFPGNVLELAT